MPLAGAKQPLVGGSSASPARRLDWRVSTGRRCSPGQAPALLAYALHQRPRTISTLCIRYLLFCSSCAFAASACLFVDPGLHPLLLFLAQLHGRIMFWPTGLSFLGLSCSHWYLTCSLPASLLAKASAWSLWPRPTSWQGQQYLELTVS